MRSLLGGMILAALVAAGSGCGGDDSPAGAPASGITGTCTRTVNLGPAGSKPQGPAPYAGAAITIYPAGAKKSVAKAVADAQGQFRVALAPGRYRVEVPDGGERTVEVTAGKYAAVTLEVVVNLPSPPPGK